MSLSVVVLTAPSPPTQPARRAGNTVYFTVPTFVLVVPTPSPRFIAVGDARAIPPRGGDPSQSHAKTSSRSTRDGHRDVEELLAERGVDVDHVTIYRWVQRFTPEFVEAARTCRHMAGDRWFVDETYVKVNGRWTYLYRAIDQHGQVIDVWLSTRRDLTAARTFFAQALAVGVAPVEVTTDRASTYPRVLDELIPTALHNTEQYANNRVEADHGRLKARLRPMRGLKTFRSARILASGHAFVQNLRRDHYDIATHAAIHHRLPAAFDELALAI